ncbi:TPA: hypothetical protein N0F65_005483, partial [Lagenidium giganteum]
ALVQVRPILGDDPQPYHLRTFWPQPLVHPAVPRLHHTNAACAKHDDAQRELTPRCRPLECQEAAQVGAQHGTGAPTHSLRRRRRGRIDRADTNVKKRLAWNFCASKFSDRLGKLLTGKQVHEKYKKAKCEYRSMRSGIPATANVAKQPEVNIGISFTLHLPHVWESLVRR